MPTPLVDAEKRLQERYARLVQEHLGQASSTAAGPRTLPAEATAFAATQAAWRFYHNPRLSLPTLAQPLLDSARTALAQGVPRYALVVHDWSELLYREHASKRDRIVLGNAAEVGYELYTALLLRDTDGQTLAPLCQTLEAADGIHSSRHARLQRRSAAQTRLDRLGPVLQFVDDLELGVPVVHLIDREADSVFHYRLWHRKGRRWVVRADAERLVRHEGQERTLPQVTARLRQRGAFQEARRVNYEGQRLWQWVAEAEVVLERPACLNRLVEGVRKRLKIHGPALAVRLVISQLRDAEGKVVAEWFLLTNVPAADVGAAEVALWYYWRWRVESYFKLLKSAGHQVERWQQETAAALVRRLVVASMACVLVWQVARSTHPAAGRLRKVLVRLSGRQMKWGREFTEPALLAGLWVLLALLDVAEQYRVPELRALAALALSGGTCDSS